jgi:hypothetical protein
MWNFCGFGLKRRLNFCGFLFLRIVNLGTEKKIVCITGRNNWRDATIKKIFIRNISKFIPISIQLRISCQQYRLLILSRSVNKHGRYRPFFFMIGWFLKNLLLWNRLATKWVVFIEDLPRMLPTMFRFIWQSGFRGEDFLEISQSETRMACGGHVC